MTPFENLVGKLMELRAIEHHMDFISNASFVGFEIRTGHSSFSKFISLFVDYYRDKFCFWKSKSIAII
jgi:hypothetical protein